MFVLIHENREAYDDAPAVPIQGHATRELAEAHKEAMIEAVDYGTLAEAEAVAGPLGRRIQRYAISRAGRYLADNLHIEEVEVDRRDEDGDMFLCDIDSRLVVSSMPYRTIGDRIKEWPNRAGDFNITVAPLPV